MPQQFSNYLLSVCHTSSAGTHARESGGLGVTAAAMLKIAGDALTMITHQRNALDPFEKY